MHIVFKQSVLIYYIYTCMLAIQAQVLGVTSCQSLCEQIYTPPTILLVFCWQTLVKKYLNRGGLGIEEQL